jgi:phosphoglucosamine mutase
MERCDIYPQAVEGHMERVLGGFPEKVRVKAVVDCGCGAASVITPQLLKRMGADVVALNCHTSGFPPRGIEPNDENLKDLAKVTRGLSADLGIAHDGDADRMMVIDDEGRFVPGDKLLAIFSREMGARKVITNADASMAIEELGFEVVRTRVGDAFVSQELKGGGDFGGEPSGSWVFPAISYCPDGIYAAAKITQIASRAKLSRLVDELPSYFVLRGSVPGEGSVMADLEQRLRHLKPVSVNTIDGVGLVFEDGWLLVRASGTEPKVRITAEAKSEGRAEELYREGERALKR